MNIQYTVNLDDVDFMGIVGHWHWLKLMERLRTAAFAEIFAPLVTKGIGFVIAEAKIQYKRPATYNQSLIMELDVINIRPTNATIRHTFKDSKGDILVVGELVLVCVNKEGKPYTIPDDFKEQFEKQMVTQ